MYCFKCSEPKRMGFRPLHLLMPSLLQPKEVPQTWMRWDCLRGKYHSNNIEKNEQNTPILQHFSIKSKVLSSFVLLCSCFNVNIPTLVQKPEMYSLGETFVQKLESAIFPSFSAVKLLDSLKGGLLIEVRGKGRGFAKSLQSCARSVATPYHNVSSVLIYLFPEQRTRKARSI